jgi:hypothetical protein
MQDFTMESTSAAASLDLDAQQLKWIEETVLEINNNNNSNSNNKIQQDFEGEGRSERRRRRSREWSSLEERRQEEEEAEAKEAKAKEEEEEKPRIPLQEEIAFRHQQLPTSTSKKRSISPGGSALEVSTFSALDLSDAGLGSKDTTRHKGGEG